jgi:hypothetical protein
LALDDDARAQDAGDADGYQVLLDALGARPWDEDA